jgi:hypothetical protein
MSIYDGPSPHESQCKLKLIGRVINTVSPTVQEYLRWSESPITFDRTDHPDSIPGSSSDFSEDDGGGSHRPQRGHALM